MKKKVHAHWGSRKGRFRAVVMKGVKFRRVRKGVR